MGSTLKNKAVWVSDIQEGDLWAGKGWVLLTLHIPDSVIIFCVDVYSLDLVVHVLKNNAVLLVKTF